MKHKVCCVDDGISCLLNECERGHVDLPIHEMCVLLGVPSSLHKILGSLHIS